MKNLFDTILSSCHHASSPAWKWERSWSRPTIPARFPATKVSWFETAFVHTPQPNQYRTESHYVRCVALGGIFVHKAWQPMGQGVLASGGKKMLLVWEADLRDPQPCTEISSSIYIHIRNCGGGGVKLLAWFFCDNSKYNILQIPTEQSQSGDGDYSPLMCFFSQRNVNKKRIAGSTCMHTRKPLTCVSFQSTLYRFCTRVSAY